MRKDGFLSTFMFYLVTVSGALNLGIVLMAVGIAIMILCGGCQTMESGPDDVTHAVEIETRNGTNFGPADLEQIPGMEAGCVRQYGAGAKLVRIVKTGKLSYYAICRRAE